MTTGDGNRVCCAVASELHQIGVVPGGCRESRRLGGSVADFWLISGNISATTCKTVMENVFYYETTWLWFILLSEIV